MAIARRVTLLSIFALVGTMFATNAVAESDNEAMDLLKRSVDLYSTLPAYADSGTAVREGPGLVDRWKFKTYFSRPRNFANNPYPFRADSHFLYLVGQSIEGAALVLDPAGDVLYVPPPDPEQELWTGPMPS